jgi:hypothetical protein
LILSCALVLVASASNAVAAPVRNGMLAFVDTSTGAPGIGVASADGSDRRLLTRPLPTVGEPSWNRRSGLIAFDLGRTIATVRPDGRGLHRITGSPDTTDSSPAWSPDGTRIAFYRVTDANNSETVAIVVADPRGRRQRAFVLAGGLTQNGDSGALAAPRWSRDRILSVPTFDRTHERNAKLSIDLRTGKRTMVDTPKSCLTVPVPAPSGGLSVCGALGHAHHEDVWLMRSGRRVRRLLSLYPYATNVFPGTAVWDPSGTRIALGIGTDRVSVFRLDGRRTTYRVPLHVSDPGGRDPLVMSWSADGTHLAVAAGAAGWGVEALDVRSGRFQLLVAHSEDSDPEFSPDGSRLAYLHTGAAGSTEIRVFAGLRGPSTRLADSVSAPGIGVYAWSPPSTDIAFVTASSSLAVVSLDGSKPREIAVDATSDPTWSPDATTIAYDTVQSGTGGIPDPGNAIHFVHADGTPSPLGSIPGTSYVQWWSPDGGSIGFTLASGGVAELELETGVLTKRDAWHGGRGAALSPDGTRAVFAAIGYGKYLTYYTISLVGLDGAPIADAFAVSPAIWSADGQFVAYATNEGDGSDLSVQDAVAVASSTAIAAPLASIENASQPTWQPLPA